MYYCTCSKNMKVITLPSRRRPLEIHSNTRRKASPGPRGCWLLLMAFSTNSSNAYENKQASYQQQIHLVQLETFPDDLQAKAFSGTKHHLLYT